jgi:hypothetical protein
MTTNFSDLPLTASAPTVALEKKLLHAYRETNLRQ